MQTSPCMGGGKCYSSHLPLPLSHSEHRSAGGSTHLHTLQGTLGSLSFLWPLSPSLSPWDPSPLPGCSGLPSKWVEP